MSSIRRVPPRNQVWSLEEVVKQTPSGKFRQMVPVKPSKPRRKRATQVGTSTSSKPSETVSGWDAPWQDDDHPPLALFDPVPQKSLQEAIDDDSKVRYFDDYIDFLLTAYLSTISGPAYILEGVSWSAA